MEPQTSEIEDERVRPVSVVDEVAARIQRNILDDRYHVGESLPPERELAQRYGVTRTSLKHALVRLEQLGLIETRHGIGSIVQDVQEAGSADLLKSLIRPGQPDAPLVRQLLEARTLIGGAFAKLAAQRRRASDLNELEKLVDELAAHASESRRVQELENAFVRALARASGNRAFLFLTNSVSAAYRLQLRAYEGAFRDGAWVASCLREILDAVRSVDAERARDVTEAYFAESARRAIRTPKGRP